MQPMSISGIAENTLVSWRMASAVAQTSDAIAQAKEFARLGSERRRLLIVTDCPDRLAGLRALLQADGFELTSAISPEELSRACRHEHDLAVVDVGPARLPEALKALRGSLGHAAISVFVEASRIVAEPSLDGILPKYRAMPCSRSDLAELMRHQGVSTDRSWRRRTLL